MRVDTFDFYLPAEKIALRPASPRDSAKLLVVDPNRSNKFNDAGILDLPNYLSEGDAIVFNNTKVIPAELHGIRDRGGNKVAIKLNLIKRKDKATWICLAKPAKRLKNGDNLLFSKGKTEVYARVVNRIGGEIEIEFDETGMELDRIIHTIGNIPLPPYISSRRENDKNDDFDYQTMFAKYEGAVAAPTASLHFTERLIQSLKIRNISMHFLTLHVGAGTFLPVSVEDTDDHRMHEEWGEVTSYTADSLNQVHARGGKILAVGTTVLRLLESAVDKGGKLAEFRGETSIFITPGYKFLAIDMLLTNFHLPRSTLFMLVSAFSGLETMKEAYKHAMKGGYRFYSYGDGSLLFPKMTK